MKIFACITGWLVCAILSALIGKKFLALKKKWLFSV